MILYLPITEVWHAIPMNWTHLQKEYGMDFQTVKFQDGIMTMVIEILSFKYWSTQCLKWAGTQRNAVPELLYFRLLGSATFFCVPVLTETDPTQWQSQWPENRQYHKTDERLHYPRATTVPYHSVSQSTGPWDYHRAAGRPSLPSSRDAPCGRGRTHSSRSYCCARKSHRNNMHIIWNCRTRPF